MAAQSMDDSNIRDLEKKCKDANEAFHAQADVTIKHADILGRQVATGKIDSAKFRVAASLRKNSSGSIRPPGFADRKP